MEISIKNTSVSYRNSQLYRIFTVCFIAGVFGGITSTLMSSYLPTAIKELMPLATELDRERAGAVINSLFLFGMMFGGIFCGIIGDKKGRKLSFQISVMFLGLFTLLVSFSTDWLMIAGLRFLTGFGVGGVLVSTTILIDEIWSEKKKAIALGILSITIPVGIFSAGIITYFFDDWRSGFLSGVIPVLLAIAAHWMIPESEKWRQYKLQVKNQSADKIDLFGKSTLRDLVIGCIIYGAMLIGLWAIFSWLPTWIESMADEGDVNKMIGTGMMLFAIGGLSGGFVSGWVSNFLGMKRTMIICFAMTFIFSFILFRLNSTIHFFSYLEMAGIAVFFGISQGALNVYIPELFSVQMRSSATGFCFNAGRLFTASAVFFVGWLVHILNGYGNALFIFSFIFLIGLIATLFAKDNIKTQNIK